MKKMLARLRGGRPSPKTIDYKDAKKLHEGLFIYLSDVLTHPDKHNIIAKTIKESVELEGIIDGCLSKLADLDTKEEDVLLERNIKAALGGVIKKMQDERVNISVGKTVFKDLQKILQNIETKMETKKEYSEAAFKKETSKLQKEKEKTTAKETLKLQKGEEKTTTKETLKLQKGKEKTAAPEKGSASEDRSVLTRGEALGDLDVFPDEMLIQIFSNLRVKDLVNLQLTNSVLKRIAKDPILVEKFWAARCERDYPNLELVFGVDLPKKGLQTWKTHYAELTKLLEEALKSEEEVKASEDLFDWLCTSDISPGFSVLKRADDEILIDETFASLGNDLDRIGKIPQYEKLKVKIVANILKQAIQQNSVNGTKWALSQGAEVAPDILYEGALQLAADRGNPIIVWSVLQYAVNEINTPNEWRDTPLTKAIESGRPEVVQLLIEFGANVNYTDGNRNEKLPLHAAVGSHSWDKHIAAGSW